MFAPSISSWVFFLLHVERNSFTKRMQQHEKNRRKKKKKKKKIYIFFFFFFLLLLLFVVVGVHRIYTRFYGTDPE